jgi:hypothetical protein
MIPGGQDLPFVGMVERLGFGSPSRSAAALFTFDEALVIIWLGVALPGFRTSKKKRHAVNAFAESDDLTPQRVRDQWPKGECLAVTSIERAELKKSAQGALYGTLILQILDVDGTRHVFLAHRSVRESLTTLLKSVLGDRLAV